MKEILIFAGTTEGRKLSERLSESGIANTLCVATEYGESVIKRHPLTKVHCGRMNQEEIREYIAAGKFAAVVDATHPYAELITENLKTVLKDSDIPYLRLKREEADVCAYEKIFYFDSHAACAKALESTEGNILLTIGSKQLAVYCSSGEMKSRLYVRVLPGLDSLRLCREQGIAGKQILALQGPFGVEMNEAMIRQYRIKCLVTKASGKTGGYREKLEAAQKAGILVFVIGQEKQDEGYSFEEVCQKLEGICNQDIARNNCLEIILAGVGMGDQIGLTREVYQAIADADILFGAKRIIEGYHPGRKKKAFYKAEQIIPCLKEMDEGRAVVLFSGDSGFYSGCQSLYRALQEEIRKGGLKAAVRILPGISSVAYFASCIGESYQDAAIYSMHGKEVPNLAGRIRHKSKTFLLLSGAKDINRLGKALLRAGLDDCEVLAGYQLSYSEQQVMTLTPEECCEKREEGLYICCIKNPHAQNRELTHGRADTEFVRAKVPMTKEEVREVSICKLKLYDNAVVYDIGGGTGSVSIEIAGLSDDIQVYAIECREEAADLIRLNRERFQLENIKVISETAPEGLRNLPAPTHAFIGGSGGKLKEILSTLYQRNPRMRVVINAVSLETICELKEVLSFYPVEKEEFLQMQVSRVRDAGAYHMIQGENPVWICSFNFRKADTDEIEAGDDSGA